MSSFPNGPVALSAKDLRVDNDPAFDPAFVGKHAIIPVVGVPENPFDSSVRSSVRKPIACSIFGLNDETIQVVRLNQPQRVDEPIAYPFELKQECALISHPMYIGADIETGGELLEFTWDVKNYGHQKIDTILAGVGQNPVDPADWTDVHFFLRASDSPDMTNGSDWIAFDQGNFLVFGDPTAFIELSEPHLWNTSDAVYLPLTFEPNVSGFPLFALGGELVKENGELVLNRRVFPTIRLQGVDSVGHFIQTKIPAGVFNENQSAGAVAIFDPEDVIHRYFNVTIESDTPGSFLELLISNRLFSNTGGRAPLFWRRRIEISRVNEPIEYFIDISDSDMFDYAPLQETVDGEKTDIARLEYVGIKVVEPITAKVKVYRSRLVNGVFNPRATKTQPIPNPSKGVGRFDFQPSLFQGLNAGRFIQFMILMSTTRPPTSPELRDKIEMKVKGGSFPSPSDLMGYHKKWESPGIDPEFATLVGAAAKF